MGSDTVVVAIVFRWTAVTCAPRIGKQGGLALSPKHPFIYIETSDESDLPTSFEYDELENL